MKNLCFRKQTSRKIFLITFAMWKYAANILCRCFPWWTKNYAREILVIMWVTKLFHLFEVDSLVLGWKCLVNYYNFSQTTESFNCVVFVVIKRWKAEELPHTTQSKYFLSKLSFSHSTKVAHNNFCSVWQNHKTKSEFTIRSRAQKKLFWFWVFSNKFHLNRSQ